MPSGSSLVVPSKVISTPSSTVIALCDAGVVTIFALGRQFPAEHPYLQ